MKTRISTLLVLLFVCHLTFSQTNPDIRVYHEKRVGKLVILADNYGASPQSVKLQLSYDGFKVDGKLPKYHLIPPHEKQVVLVEMKIIPSAPQSYSYKYTPFFGDVTNAKHDDSFQYILPFRSDKAMKLTQGYNGKFSHKRKYALDFTMPEGTEIVAARAGKIVKIKKDSNKGCANKKCADDANYIIVLHDDGSYAEYMHLKQNGVVVNLDDQVEQGQLIGYSGNTGFTSGPHLHFQVNVPTNKGPWSLQTSFSIKGVKSLLAVGTAYKSEH